MLQKYSCAYVFISDRRKYQQVATGGLEEALVLWWGAVVEHAAVIHTRCAHDLCVLALLIPHPGDRRCYLLGLLSPAAGPLLTGRWPRDHLEERGEMEIAQG